MQKGGEKKASKECFADSAIIEKMHKKFVDKKKKS